MLGTIAECDHVDVSGAFLVYKPLTYRVNNLHFDRDKNSIHKFGKCQFLQCKGVITRVNVRDFSSYLLKPGFATTRKPKGGCKGQCLGDNTCDTLVGRFQRSCQQLEKDFQDCDCTGCKCPKPKPPTSTTVTGTRSTRPPPGSTGTTVTGESSQ